MHKFGIASYRKKPVIIQAMQLTIDNLERAEYWSGGSLRGIRLPRQKWELEISTPEGDMRARIGDWVIKGTRGEFYPCKPEIFTDIYELVEKENS